MNDRMHNELAWISLFHAVASLYTGSKYGHDVESIANATDEAFRKLKARRAIGLFDAHHNEAPKEGEPDNFGLVWREHG